MGEITNRLGARPVVEEIHNIEIEVLPYEIQDIDTPLAPEIISGQHAAAVNEETDSDFRPLTEITNQIGTSTAVTAPVSPEPVIEPIWPWAALALGFVLTAIWICRLGYGLVN